MRIGILGPLQVLGGADGPPIGIGGARLRALLIRLALDPGRLVVSERLVQDLWEDRPPSDPAGALQSLVSRLRRALDADPGTGRAAIGSHPSGYRLDLPPDAVDAWAFERAAAEGRAALGAGEFERAVRVLREALSLWRGDPLADAGAAAFAAAPAARLREVRLAAVEDRVDAELALAGTGVPEMLPGLIAELTELCTADPLRERFAARLMRALQADGQQAAALEAYDRTRRALAEELGTDPGPELRDVHLRVLRGDAPAGKDTHSAVHSAARSSGPGARAGSGPGGLPARSTSFVGRTEELAEVRRLLGEHRLVTLTGPGGVGKTRLAVETGAAFEVRRPGEERRLGEVRMVELASAAGPGAVVAAVLTAVCRPAVGVLAGGLPAGPAAAGSAGDPVDRIVQELTARPVVLLLDNCEHVVDEAALVVGRLLAAAPQVRVLATSREPLGVPGEALHPVRPLAVPGPGADPEEARTHSAVALFADRAAAVSPGFTVDAASAPHVVRLCRELDGIPLAIELAAARLRSLTPAQLAGRLDDRLRLLAQGSRTALPRHRTLRAVIDWSWALLVEDERVLLRRLSVFSGGAGLADAHRVCAGHWPGGERPDETAVQDLLAALVDKSLVVLLPAADSVGAERYRLLETVREYAAGRLAEAGETETVGAAHTECFLELAETAEPLLRTADQLAWLARIDAEQGNLDAALRREIRAAGNGPGSAERGLRLAAARVWPWLMRGQGHQAGERTAEVLRVFGATPPPGAEQAHGICVIVAQLTLSLRGDGDAAVAEAFTGALVTAQQADHPIALAAALIPAMGGSSRGAAQVAERFSTHANPWIAALAPLVLGRMELSGGRVRRAEECLRTSLLRFRRLRDRWGLALALITLAGLLSVTGEVAEAMAALDEARRYDAEVGGAGESPMLLVLSGQLLARGGDLSAARAELEQAHDIALRNRDPQLQLASRYAIGELARRTGEFEEALNCQQQVASSLQDRIAAGPGSPDQVQLLALLHTSLGRIRLRLGSPEQAAEAHRRALELAADCGDHPVRAAALEGFAEYCLAHGDAGRSAAALGAAHALRGTHDAGDPELRELRDGCRAALGADGFAAAWRHGRRLPRPETLSLPPG
ncbi:BTAD domain-containing putative transcriptional regulator [Kitasatospora cystarginea]|uniref:BTAD domain-containing putative transcriptional regulator n=1 Tax=Kitasatospora cystarginea TaxID=58350 RepID=A0ABN3DZX5_9ACTN